MDQKTPRKLHITETVLRDAHQSILATRMRTEQMLPIAEQLDAVGFWSLELWGGATFDACIRFLKEDPWERLRALRKAMPRTRFQMLLRGQNLVGYRHYADDVVIRFIELSAENGIDIFRIFDALNDTRNLETAIQTVKRVGRHAEGTISFTTSPDHTIAGFVDMGKRLEDMGVDTICIKDMAGLITPPQVYELVNALKQAVRLPIHLHSHCTSGVAVGSYLKAVEAGVDIVDTSISSISMGTGQPSTESIVAMFHDTLHDTGLDLNRLAEIAKYFGGVRKELAEWESGLKGSDARMLVYQVPGGMLSNMESQLREQGASTRYQEVLEEVPRVRADLGNIPLVTPTSQIVGTQAVMNVLAGQRYKMLTRETEDIVRGMYGQTPGKVNPELVKRVLGNESPITCRPADLLTPELDRHREEIGDLARCDEDVISYTLFPQITKNFLEFRTKPPVPGAAASGAPAPSNPALAAEANVRPWHEQVKIKRPAAPPVPGASATFGPGTYTVTVNGQSYAITIAPGEGEVQVNGPMAGTAAAAPRATPVPNGTPVASPMGGNVFRITRKVGDLVKQGDVIVSLEAMKMEMEVTATQGGHIQQICVKEGDAIMPGHVVAYIA